MNIVEELQIDRGGQWNNKIDNNILLSLSFVYLYCASYNNCFVDMDWFLYVIALYKDCVLSFWVL